MNKFFKFCINLLRKKSVITSGLFVMVSKDRWNAKILAVLIFLPSFLEASTQIQAANFTAVAFPATHRLFSPPVAQVIDSMIVLDRQKIGDCEFHRSTAKVAVINL
ncbi:MAG: hypothetical protein AAGN35_18555 [Bacteroidota bacterium]